MAGLPAPLPVAAWEEAAARAGAFLATEPAQLIVQLELATAFADDNHCHDHDAASTTSSTTTSTTTPRSATRSPGPSDIRARLPPGWGEALAALSMADAQALALGWLPPPTRAAALPSDLCGFVAAACAARLFRPHAATEQQVRQHSSHTTVQDPAAAHAAQLPAFDVGPLPALPPLLRTGLKPKKVHEVQRLAALTAAVARQAGCRRAVDMGSGKGYLGKILTVIYGLDVVGVERQESLNEQAVGETERAAQWLQRMQGADVVAPGRLSTVTAFVGEGSDGTAPVQTQLLDHAVLVGLHACGDLSPFLIRSFVRCALDNPTAPTALVSLGCCYHHMTEAGLANHHRAGAGSDCSDAAAAATAAATASAASAEAAASSNPSSPHPTPTGFPMSEFVRRLRLPPLGLRGRENACHQTDGWSTFPEHRLTCHARRAMVAVVLRRLAAAGSGLSTAEAAACSSLRLARLRVREPPADSGAVGFATYVEQALTRAQLFSADSVAAGRRLAVDVYEEYAPRQAEVAAVHALELLCAQVTESLLLIDRVLFIHEQLAARRPQVHLLPLFDARLSPRNMAVVATLPRMEEGQATPDGEHREADDRLL